MNDTRKPVRQRKKRFNPAFLAIILSIAVLIALLILLGMLAQRRGLPAAINPTPTPSTSATVPQSQSAPSEPVTEPSAPTVPTEPPEPTVEEIISEFAQANGLTLADYPEKLIELLKRNPETREYVLNYPLEYGKPHTEDISGYGGEAGVPLFIQWDRQWGYRDYAGNVAGLSACGPTCLSMVAYHFFRDTKYTPGYMMDFAENNKYANSGSGTQWSLFQKGAKELGLNVQELTLEQSQTESYIAKTLDSGKVIVMNVRPGVFTTVGHYLLLTGYEDGKFRVNDPNSYANSEKLWEFEEFSDQVRIMWAISE